MKNKFFDKPEAIPFIIFNIFITFVFIFLLFSVCDSVHAEDFPVYFPMNQNENSHFDSSMRRLIDDNLDTTNYYYFVSYLNQDLSYANDNFYYVRYPKSEGSGHLFAEIFNNGYQFSLYQSGNPSLEIGAAYIHWVGGVTPEFHFDRSVTLEVFQELNSSSFSSARGYLSNFRLYTSSNVNNRSIVLNYGVGHHHEPKPPRDSQEDPSYSSGDSAPTIVPNTSGSSSDFSMLAKTLQYYGNLINHNNNSNFQNLYENLLPQYYFFSQIYNFGLDDDGNFNLLNAFSNIFEYLFIPDPDDLAGVLVSHDIYDVIGLVETTQGNVEYVKSMITGGENLYKLTLPQFTIMGVVLGPYDIDFSWYIPLKNTGDPIIAAFLIFGWVMWLHTRLPYWLRGQQGDITLMTKEVQK